MSKPSRKTLMILGGVAGASLVLGAVAWMPPLLPSFTAKENLNDATLLRIGTRFVSLFSLMIYIPGRRA